MNQEDIAKLRKRIEERTERFRASLTNNSHKNPDEALSTLHGTVGWDIVSASIDAMIAELLEPEEFAGDAVSYAVSGESRRLTIQALRSIVGAVNSVVASRQSGKVEGGVSE